MRHPCKVCVVGLPSSGKTALITRLSHDDFDPLRPTNLVVERRFPSPTHHAHETCFRFWDIDITLNHFKPGRSNMEWLSDSHVILLTSPTDDFCGVASQWASIVDSIPDEGQDIHVVPVRTMVDDPPAVAPGEPASTVLLRPIERTHVDNRVWPTSARTGVGILPLINMLNQAAQSPTPGVAQPLASERRSSRVESPGRPPLIMGDQARQPTLPVSLTVSETRHHRRPSMVQVRKAAGRGRHIVGDNCVAM